MRYKINTFIAIIRSEICFTVILIFIIVNSRLSPRVTKSPHAVSKPTNNLTTIEHQSENDVECWTGHHNDPNGRSPKQQHAQDWNEERLLEGVNTITYVSEPYGPFPVQ